MNNKVLFIAVHPDDETLGCGGTILKHKEKGDKVYWLILTKANQRTQPDQDLESKVYQWYRKM